MLRLRFLVASREAISWHLPSPREPPLSHCRCTHRDQSERQSKIGMLTQLPLPQIGVASRL
jgi:hypothetical protein